MKYNKSMIMKRAWEFKKATNDTFNACLKKAWAEAKSLHRIIKRRIHYSVFKSIKNKNLAEGVYMEKGEYHAEDKTIDVILTFDECFLFNFEDKPGVTKLSTKMNVELLNKFNETKDEDIVFSEEIRKMAINEGITSNFILQNYCGIKGDSYIAEEIEKDKKLGRTSYIDDFKKLQEIRKNIFCVEIW